LIGWLAVVNYCRNKLHVYNITPRFVKSEVLARNLVPYKVANRNCFVPADVVAWINSMKADTRTKQQNATASR